MIPIYRPYLPSKYIKSANECLRTGWVSNHGVYIHLAADKLAQAVGIKHIILMSNGTCATHALFMAVRFKYPTCHTFYLPNECFVAPHNCAQMEYGGRGDVSFHLLKMDHQTMNMCVDEQYINTIPAGACVVVVHNYGNIVDVPRLIRLRPDVVFIEDNCEGLFGIYPNGKMAGSASLCSSVSFYGNKILTTGEGGAFMTNDTELYTYMCKVYSHGMTATRYVHDVMGYNYRMTNVQAAMLYDQLMDLNTVLDMKKHVFELYRVNICGLTDQVRRQIQVVNMPFGANWIFSIKIDKANMVDFTYNDMDTFFEHKLVQIRPFFYNMYAHAHLRDLYALPPPPLVNWIGIMLPSSPDLTQQEISYVVSILGQFITSRLIRSS